MNKDSLKKTRIKQRNRVAEKKRYWLRLTNACNNNCIFCLDAHNLNGTCRSLKDIKSELRKKATGTEKLILSGGDPTVHPNFLQIVKLSRDMRFNEIQVISNGRMFYYRDFLKRAVANGMTEITFSFHGHTKDIYEKQTRIKGSYRQALAGLSNALKVKNLIVNMDVVINKINYKHLEDILRFFINLGVAEFDLLQVVPFGRAWQNKRKVFYNLKKAGPYLRRAFRLQFEFPDIFIWTNRFPPQYLEGVEELIQHPIKLYDEIRGRKKMFEKFIDGTELMSCFGGQCKYCFLQNFCSDLIKLKEKKEIHGRKFAFCLEPNSGVPEKFKTGKKIDVDKFLDFYIKHRYFLKSLRCSNCRYFKRCDGAPIKFVKAKGFKPLKLIR